MFEISRVCQVIEAEGRDGMGDDQVLVLRRGGQRAQRPEKRRTSQWQRGEPGQAKAAFPASNDGAWVAREAWSESTGRKGRSGIRVSKLVRCFTTDVGHFTLVTSPPKVQVENP
jgi:hypothetical protein